MDYNLKYNKYCTEELSLYNCDNMELLRQTPDNYYCLSIVDPPYGIGASKQSKTISKLKGRKTGAIKRS